MRIKRRSICRLLAGFATALGVCLAGLLPGIEPAKAGDSGTSYVVRHGHAPFYTAHLFPGSTLTLSEAALREAGENVVALTFDDGPSPVNDTEILRLLAEVHGVATFFVIGNKAAGHLDILQRMVAAGCEIGNHSWQHPMLTRLGADTQLDELRRTNDVLVSAGIPVRWFRPPFGDFDSLTNTIAQSEALQTILWSVDSRDWKGSPPEVIAQRVIDDISPGAVILMHSTKTHTVAALPKILEFLKANNYRLVTLSEWERIMIKVNPIALRLAAKPEVAKTETTKPENARPESAKPVSAKLAEVPRTEPAKALR